MFPGCHGGYHSRFDDHENLSRQAEEEKIKLQPDEIRATEKWNVFLRPGSKQQGGNNE